jgi:hypothetical protein
LCRPGTRTPWIDCAYPHLPHGPNPLPGLLLWLQCDGVSMAALESISEQAIAGKRWAGPQFWMPASIKQRNAASTLTRKKPPAKRYTPMLPLDWERREGVQGSRNRILASVSRAVPSYHRPGNIHPQQTRPSSSDCAGQAVSEGPRHQLLQRGYPSVQLQACRLSGCCQQ